MGDKKVQRQTDRHASKQTKQTKRTRVLLPWKIVKVLYLACNILFHTDPSRVGVGLGFPRPPFVCPVQSKGNVKKHISPQEVMLSQCQTKMVGTNGARPDLDVEATPHLSLTGAANQPYRGSAIKFLCIQKLLLLLLSCKAQPTLFSSPLHILYVHTTGVQAATQFQTNSHSLSLREGKRGSKLKLPVVFIEKSK